MCSLVSSKCLLKILEEFEFFVLLVQDYISIDIIGIVSGPFNISRIVISDTFKVELARNTCYKMSRLSGDHLISQLMPHITDLINTNIPLGTIFVVDPDD